MTRIVTNTLLHPTKRIIENWNRDFRTSDGPNTSSFINLDDIAIPYDSHYTSRIVLPANATDYYLNYGVLDSATFLLIKVTYNGNYDYPNEDSFDPLYYYEPQNYNINYYFEGNSGKTYPIGKILLLNGSLTNKIEKIYLNNPLDYDVVLDVFHANIDESVQPPTPINSAITITNLYYSDITTDQTVCVSVWYTTTTTSTTIYDSGSTSTITTTTTTNNSGTTTTTTTNAPKNLMKVTKKIVDGYHIFSSTGSTIGFFDYYINGEWIYAGRSTSFVEFTDLHNIRLIRFYFTENPNYYGTLKTDTMLPYEHNNGLYFVDILPNGFYVDIYGIPSDLYDSYFNSGNTYSYGDYNSTNDIISFTGSTGFIINQYVINLSGYSINSYFVPYYDIISIDKDTIKNVIYLNTTNFYYILNFLTSNGYVTSYNRIMAVYNSYLNGDCVYLTEYNIYVNHSDSPFTTTTTTTTQSIFTKSPSIYYKYNNSEQFWSGGTKNIPFNVSLNMLHGNYTGWTSNQLLNLFIEYVYDVYDSNVDINSVVTKIYKNCSFIETTGINSTGLYDVVFSYTDIYGNNITNKIEDINVIYNSPVIFYKEYILTGYLSGNTNSYTGVTNHILPNIIISSGFTFNLPGFNNLITKIDIIDNLIEYVLADSGEFIDKHAVNIVIAKGTIYGSQNIYDTVTNPGIYCIEVSLEDIFGNKTIRYFIMNVISDSSVYSIGFWQDNKVWFDYVNWLDHPIIGV